MTPEQHADLLARVTKAQSVGATILSNMSAAKRILLSNPPTDPAPVYAPEYPDRYGTEPYGDGPYGTDDPLTEG